MYFKQFLHDERGCASYFLASRESREAVVIDPQLDIQPYLDLAQERGYQITLVIDTHLHADHVSGNRKLAARTGARLCLHEAAEVDFAFSPLHDGDELALGQLRLRVFHTPGHRPESISLAVVNPPRSPEPSMVLSGDTLFVGDVGRPDFGGPKGAREQYESIQKLLRLEDYVEVFPAHFEGHCGKAMCGRPSSTIGFERRFNPVVNLPEAEFLKLAEEAPPRPLNMTAILATNQGKADYAWTMAGEGQVPSITAGEAAAWLAERDALVIDVREPTEFVAGHIPGALSIPQADLAVRAGELPTEQETLVVCAGGARSLQAAEFLAGHGFPRITNLAGGTMGWKDAGHPIAIGAE
jgi:hydroxyacylglutathione hydrolase